MNCDTSEIYFPIRKLKEVMPREVFAFSPTGRPFTRVGINSDFTKFMIMALDHNDCHYPGEEEMGKEVYMLQATVKITMIEGPKRGTERLDK